MRFQAGGGELKKDMKNAGRLAVSFFRSEFALFMLVGALNTAFSYGVYAFFIFIGFHYSLASFLQLFFSILFNFQTIGKLVFKNNDNKRLISFILVCLFMYLFYVLGLKALNYIGFNNYAAGAVMIIPVSVLSYFLNKVFVFKPENKGKNK